jgi:hypothetical protein
MLSKWMRRSRKQFHHLLLSPDASQKTLFHQWVRSPQNLPGFPFGGRAGLSHLFHTGQQPLVQPSRVVRSPLFVPPIGYARVGRSDRFMLPVRALSVARRQYLLSVMGRSFVLSIHLRRLGLVG